MMKKVLFLGLTLAVISAIAAFSLAYTYAVTRSRIAQQIWEEQIKAAKAVLPEVTRNEDFKEKVELADEIRKQVPLVDKVFEGYSGGALAGYAVQCLPRGYGGPITLMVGIRPNGETTGIKVVENKETPGLGSGIEDPAWNKQFQGRKPGDPLRVNKEYDAISGATISSKAIGNGVRAALESYKLIGGGAQ
jgi:Na+-translocating ferredoxin:NAD+ oxidoreductase subunit G